MLDNEMPGAALEAPDTFQRLAAPLWPRLPLALSYSGGARWVAFYVSVDKVQYHYGSSFGTGDTGLFLAYKRHPVIAPSLAGAPWTALMRNPANGCWWTKRSGSSIWPLRWPPGDTSQSNGRALSRRSNTRQRNWRGCWPIWRRPSRRLTGPNAWPKCYARAGPTSG
jgi:hypothetical protein